METIEVKRKEFEVLETLGERSYKASRKGKVFFIKKYEGHKDEFETFIKNARRLSITAIPTPKVFLYDKHKMIVVMQYIEGENVLDLLVKHDISEELIEMIFNIDFCARNEKMLLNYYPEHFKFDGKKLYYLSFTYEPFEKEKAFAQLGIRYWYYTKDFVEYLKQKQLPVDQYRVGNEYMKNKEMALAICKYYR